MASIALMAIRIDEPLPRFTEKNNTCNVLFRGGGKKIDAFPARKAVDAYLTDRGIRDS